MESRYGASGAGVTASLLLWLTLPPGVLAADIDEFVGQPVVEVSLVSEGRLLSDPSILDLVETNVGSPLSMRQVRESVTHLFSLGRFEDVRVEGGFLEGGVSLLYELVPLAVVARIVFDGDLRVSQDELRETITTAHGSVFDVEASDSVGDTVTRYYRSRGFMNAEVTPRVSGSGDDRILRVDIRAGERAQIGQIFLSGVSVVLRTLTLDRVDVRTGQPYDGTELDRRLLEYQAQLREERYYEAELSHVVVASSGDTIDIRIDVSRGRQITVAFEGDSIPEGDVAALVPVAREGSIDEDLLEDADRRIEAFHNAQGYRDTVVTHRREIDGDGLAIVFDVDRGPLYEIAEVVFTGNNAVPTETLNPLVELTPGNPLITRGLQDAVANVADHYRRLGFATVRVEPVILDLPTTTAGNSVPVSCEIRIAEGVRTRVRSVSVVGNELVPSDELQPAVTFAAGDPYYAPRVESSRNAVRILYLNDGFERVVVTVERNFDDNLDLVDVVFRVTEGRQIRIEHVLIVGNEAIGSAAIRREITLQEGAPLSLIDYAETRRRLNALGLFRGIDIREFSHGGPGLRDVVIIVDEAPATRLSYGGGLEASVRLRRETDAEGSQAVERLEFAPRGFFQIGRGNLWGKNRSIDLFTRVSLRRKNDPNDPNEAAESRSLGFNEYRVLGTYQEPRVLGSTWDGSITGFIEQAIRPGFDLFTRGVNAQVRRQVTPRVSAAIDYGWGQNNTTNKELSPEDEPLVDRLFPQVRLSAFSGSVVHDTRDDPVNPRRGALLSIDGMVAARVIGSEVGFVKTFMGAFLFREVPGLPRVVFAAGARVGLSRAFVNSVTVVPGLPLDPEDVGSSVLSPIEIDVGELPISERFFAGGDRSVRGFALDRLGEESTIDENGFPRGGNATLVFNGELRVSVTRSIEVVGFLDGGNVFNRVSDMRLTRIRGGTGFGVRYISPVGPIRVDLGFKLDRQEFENGELERPTALHISLGQAF
jgi:outer membrane protein insertion porin family